MILANHLSRKLINEKEMKFSYFFFFIGKNGDIFRTNLALFRHFYGPNLSLQLPRTRSR